MAPLLQGNALSRLRLEQLRTLHVGPVDLTIEAGECICLSGPSGSGKTLLLRAVADLDPHQGRVLLDERAAASFVAPAWRRAVGLLPAESQWWFERIGDHFASVPEAWLGRLGFTPEVMDWEVLRCSTGERQRLALARLLLNRPQVLLLDEPTASLDPRSTEAVEALMAEYRAEHGAAVLWVSHDPGQIARVASRAFRMEAGQLLPVQS